MKEEERPQYWDRKWRLKEQRIRENVTLDGSDGELEFDAEAIRLARGKDVLDIGCGPGEFTLRVAKRARSVVGADSSKVALRMAGRNLAKKALINVVFRYGEARNLPFANESFDFAYSRRGPASDSKKCLAEVMRVLRRGGTFTEITIGERDKQNLAEIFGRGQMLGCRGQVSAVKRRWLEETGFREVSSRDYLGTEVFRSMKDLMVRLLSAPIIPSFDVEGDRRFLDAVRAKCTTERGVETPVHRVILVAKKG